MSADSKIHSLADLHKLFPGTETTSLDSQAREKNPSTAFVTLHVLLEKKGRKGSGVTVVKGFHHTLEDLKALARELKTLCGAGGTVKGDTIEIQGEHLDKVADLLREKGFTVTRHRY